MSLHSSGMSVVSFLCTNVCLYVYAFVSFNFHPLVWFIVFHYIKDSLSFADFPFDWASVDTGYSQKCKDVELSEVDAG